MTIKFAPSLLGVDVLRDDSQNIEHLGNAASITCP
jgi:hypothetical protein